MAAEFSTLALRSDPSLVAYWKLENTNDELSTYNLTNNNTVAFNAAQFSNGADFGTSNTNKFLNNNSNLGINGNGALAVSFWVKVTSEIGSGSYEFLHYDSTGGADRYFTVQYDYNGGTRRLKIDAGGGTATHNVTLGTSDFYHIVANRAASDGAIELFVNAASVATGTASTSSGANNEISIGIHTNGTSSPTSGIIDDFAVFSRVLTPTEVTTIYTGQAPSTATGFIYMSV